MVTYFLFLACDPVLVPSALVAALAPPAGAAWLAYGVAGVVAVTLALRLALAMTLRRAYGRPADPLRSLAASMLGQLVVILGGALALGPPVVAWRGARYRVHRGGLVELVE
jgi:hypothetical protein